MRSTLLGWQHDLDTIRRSLTASTAGGLAALGALVGTLCAYIVVGAGHVDDRSGLAAVPVGPITVIIVATPLVATIAGWLAAARQPTDLGRPTE